MALTQDQKDLQAYIEKQNQESRERAERDGRQIVTLPVSDPKHWAESGVYNIEEYRHYQARSDYSDFHKDRNGSRPPMRKLNTMTADEIWHDIEQVVKREEEHEEKQNQLAQERKKANAYKPNNPFAGLKDMMSNGPS